MTGISRTKNIVLGAVAALAAAASSCDAFAPQPNTQQQSSGMKAAFFDNAVDVFSSDKSKGNALIEKTKYIVDNASGFYSKCDPDVLSEDFVFRGPYVGPLNKKDYIGTMEAFSIYESLPDIKANSWGYSIDPENPNRVWFMCRNTGTFTGEPMLPDLLNVQPNGNKLEGCPETFSVTYDEDQKVKHLTVGYVADRFDGNTNGLGAAFGIFTVMNIPAPGPGLALRIIQYISSELMDIYPRSYSTDIPEWFLKEKGTDKAVQGYM